MPRTPADLNDWIYIYYIDENGYLTYDRTVSRSGEGIGRAKEVVKLHESVGRESFYTIGCIPRTSALS